MPLGQRCTFRRVFYRFILLLHRGAATTPRLLDMSIIYPCYAICSKFPLEDSAVLLVQQVGKSAALCQSGSVFESLFGACKECILAGQNGIQLFIYQYINQFYENVFDFCNGDAAVNTISTSTSSTCPPYPTITSSFSSITSYPSVAASTIIVVTTPGVAIQGIGSSPNSSYGYPLGFWLQYTFTLCPARTTNPSFSYPTSCLGPSSNLMWGCPPGYICMPPQVNCDLEVGPPNSSYLCSPEECSPLPTFTNYAVTTTVTLPGTVTVSPSSTTATVTTATITLYSPLPLNPGYYNLDPVIFGADWGLFTGEVSVTSFSNAGTVAATSTNTITTSTGTGTSKPILPPQSSSHTWIAGPVVGSLAGVAILLLIILYFLRRSRSKPADAELPQDKPQLDGKEVKPKEVAGREIEELDSTRIEPVEPVEMDTGYVGAELNARRQVNIRRKPLPQNQQSP